jgi:hypothetical protein
MVDVGEGVSVVTKVSGAGVVLRGEQLTTNRSQQAQIRKRNSFIPEWWQSSSKMKQEPANNREFHSNTAGNTEKIDSVKYTDGCSKNVILT